MTKIKICGLTRLEDIEAVNSCRPDYIGLVFAESRRQVTIKQARLLKNNLSPAICGVGVFVNAPLQYIVEICAQGIIEVIQLHGDEDQQYINQLKRLTSCPVIKAVRVKNTQLVLDAEKMLCDYLLLDVFDPHHYGGSGNSFDHSLIPILNKPFFLAGGLNSSNVEAVVKKYRPYAVDLSSGVEAKGLKSKDKIRHVVEIVRSLG
ncbi:MAG: phosphoribosylanthranilate isomerase [Syntrophomonadaceae bacterium]|jgi:phosphoribosylanthranilate isomerase|nr:phosphoribosylanthranilate isomerase [Bacillota bacterium]MDI9479557.1 phosphoribosylanthranilate isomerase [Bacillota bacterium]NLP24903.1 phosphoribosylanthranilate isomerase [Syntrophomonadaceae bacterium]